MGGNRPKLGNAFSIGGDQAEADPLLDEAFYTSGLFDAILSHDDPRCFIIGRTGSGKSALLHRLRELKPDKVVRIIPEDLSMPYITDLDVVGNMENLGVDLAPFWKALWRHVLIVEVIRNRYRIDSPDSKMTVLQTLREKLGRNAGKKEALAYLEEFEGRFWADTSERVREITNSLSRKIEAEGSASIGLSGSSVKSKVGGALEETESQRRELTHRFQRVVNETQLARLNKMMEVLDEDVLKSEQDFTYIVIDDLDKDWVDEKVRNDLILALLKTVADFKRVRNLKILVALRTNIFQHLDFGAANAGQEEKFRSLILNLSWDRKSLVELVDRRVQIAGDRQNARLESVRDLLPNQNPKRGIAIDYLLDRTLLRPRDLISFVRECLAKSEGKGQISWEAIKRAEIQYSHDRVLALRDEWKLNYPGIGLMFEKFRGSSGRMTVAEIQEILDECILLLADPAFPGSDWMSTASSRLLSGRPTDVWTEGYTPLLRLLFDIGFLGVSWKSARQPIFAHDDENALRTPSKVRDLEYFYVARMYQSALDVALNNEQWRA